MPHREKGQRSEPWRPLAIAVPYDLGKFGKKHDGIDGKAGKVTPGAVTKAMKLTLLVTIVPAIEDT